MRNAVPTSAAFHTPSSRPVTAPGPSPLRTVISGRITAGDGTGGGRSTWFSRAVAAQAVRNSRNWDTVKMKISRPRIGPNACGVPELGHRC
jgi:hypothetical protein